jgi:glc operon protein GlcG
MRLRPTLTLDDAKMMVVECNRAARELGRDGTIVIVDAGGHIIYVERPDDQSPNSVEVAAMKARTAAFRERPSSNLEARVKEKPGWLMFPHGLPMSGGVPLFYGKECVGGIAVSGIAEDDEKVAEAGAAAFAAAAKNAGA